MLSGSIQYDGNVDDDDAKTVIHPRTKRPIGKFGLIKIIVWNSTGTLGSGITGLGESLATGTYGVLELYDEYDTTNFSSTPAGSLAAPTAANRVFRVPISGKSRLVLELPGDGLIFKTGIRLAIGAEGSLNNNNKMYYQLVGYEY